MYCKKSKINNFQLKHVLLHYEISFQKMYFFQIYTVKTNKKTEDFVKTNIYSKTTECYEFFDIKNIKIGFPYLEI